MTILDKGTNMILTDEQRKTFEVAARPMIEWLNDHCGPHAAVIIDGCRCNLLEGVAGFRTEDYFAD